MVSIFRFVLRLFLGGRKASRPGPRPQDRPCGPSPILVGRASAKVLRVIDGDTVDVRLEGRRVRVRLDAIDCPEDGQPWGNTATAGLIKIIGGKTVHLEVHGIDDYGRSIATVFARHGPQSTWINVNERMVMLGHAWVMRAYYAHLSMERRRQLNRLETWARSRQVGLWKTPDPIPPWEWRHRS